MRKKQKSKANLKRLLKRQSEVGECLKLVECFPLKEPIEISGESTDWYAKPCQTKQFPGAASFVIAGND